MITLPQTADGYIIQEGNYVYVVKYKFDTKIFKVVLGKVDNTRYIDNHWDIHIDGLGWFDISKHELFMRKHNILQEYQPHFPDPIKNPPKDWFDELLPTFVTNNFKV